ncbi:Two-component signal transduction system YycFG, regulatory protein YycI [Halobacillus karajensis]|uniref:two-component system regulatory protein YycI n=1 Tax=Halobacillus karajensis TaxID=195088 RepID=UPI0008A73BB7|nr:two-component system regulatory protein YycI [Halobacillus karajensis]SEH51353.1 Two-component signal transduction system YycFG, regulatory protein YycI [Halobacillus karajensis]
MQWGQIKTLFIISFLILDLFLLYQFLNKQGEDELGQISTVAESIETELEANDITIAEGAIPKDLPEASQIESKSSHAFPEEILGQVEDMDDSDKKVELLNDNQVLKVTLDDPVEVTEETLQDVVNEMVPFSSRYSYWGWNEEEGAALFFQATNNQTIYFNNNGYLLVNIVDGKVTGYVATLLSFKEGEFSGGGSSTSEIEIEPLSAIRILVENGEIQPGDEITSMSIGYHTSYSLAYGEENSPHVFASAWKVTVNGERNHFVYAIDGTIIDYIDEGTFITDIKSKYNLSEGREVQSTANESRETN